MCNSIKRINQLSLTKAGTKEFRPRSVRLLWGHSSKSCVAFIWIVFILMPFQCGPSNLVHHRKDRLKLNKNLSSAKRRNTHQRKTFFIKFGSGAEFCWSGHQKKALVFHFIFCAPSFVLFHCWFLLLFNNFEGRSTTRGHKFTLNNKNVKANYTVLNCVCRVVRVHFNSFNAFASRLAAAKRRKGQTKQLSANSKAISIAHSRDRTRHLLQLLCSSVIILSLCEKWRDRATEAKEQSTKSSGQNHYNLPGITASNSKNPIKSTAIGKQKPRNRYLCANRTVSQL